MEEERTILTPAPAPFDRKEAKKAFSRAGWGVTALLLIVSLLQIGAASLIGAFAPELMERSWALWVLTFVPLYLIAFPIGILILRRGRRFECEGERMTAMLFLRLLLVCFFMMYAGNLIGTLINSILQQLAGVPAGNPLMTYDTDDSLILKILVMVVLAPILEELIFRKLLIDRLRGYGEKLAVLVSALIFGLFHGNLSQFFYAFGLGLVFGYVYLRTCQLRWSILLHMIVNFLGSVIAPALLAAPNGMLILIYGIALLAASVAGLVVLIKNAQRLRFDHAPEELPQCSRFSTAFLNAGMIIFVLTGLGLMVISALYVS